ncbi:hypothetical protein BCD67_20450, partial [Oscillatoriales cyanobacterium USR001]
MHQIPGYEIVEQLYSGDRTVVYRVLPIDSQTPVVLKFLQKDYPTFSELVQFRNQYTLGKNLDIPGIIKTYELEFAQNRYILSMEDFGGISLAEYLTQQGKRLPIDQFLNIACHLAITLQSLHQQRIIHKDIKPGNILINPHTKEIKITDFSISSLLPRETQEIQNPNVLEGTLAYISPEQTGRMNRGIDYRTDFYSLGVTFYELLTGQLPFVSEDAMELVHCHLAKQAIPIHQINPEIPPVLSEIVSKLMAKNAEDRYQSGLGIKHDLEICLSQLQETGKIVDFELGQRDITDSFIIPEKLYGRENEVANLLAAFERVSVGSAEMMLVAGFSGIGKTAVVNEVHKPIVRQRGYFIKGKYDQFQRNIPFSAFVQAFRDLMGQLLSESDEQLHKWKNQILAAVGDNGQVLIDVIPELENIIGKQPPATELSGSAAQNRFNLLFQKFVQVFTSIEHPLVMFLDDLQWSDSASLNLLKLLMQDTGYLLILGAYRDNEVSPVHPFMLTVDEIVKTGATVNTITLPPLSELNLNRLVADTLNCEPHLAYALTKLIAQKTQGNPFFATQFLKALHDDKLISFDWEIQHWQCDIAQVKALAVTDDVVEFMALQLQKLSIETQNILKLAACIGAEFDLNTLVIVSEKSAKKTATALWKALQEGLVIPTTKIYKFFTQSDSDRVFQASGNPTYRFLHDRVQQAAYSLIPEEQKQAIHYQIGQLLLQNTSIEQQDEKLFEIVNHLNVGMDLIQTSAERETLAELNLRAGQRAKLSTAYTAAITYLTTGRELLTENHWITNHALTLELHLELAEVAYINSNFEQSQSLTKLIHQKAQTILEHTRAYEIEILSNTVQLRMLAAIDLGLHALAMLEVHLLEPNASHGFGIEMPDLESLDANQEMTAPDKLAALRILGAMTYPIFAAKPEMLLPQTLTMISLCQEFGDTAILAYAYSLYGTILVSLNELDSGYHASQLALKLLEKFKVKTFKAKIFNMVYAHINHWKEATRNSLKPLQEGFAAGMETGDIEFAGYCANNYCAYLFAVGENLDAVLEQQNPYIEALIKLKLETSINFAGIWKQLGLNFAGRAAERLQLTGAQFDEVTLLPDLIASKNTTVLFALYAAKTILFYQFGAYPEAIEQAELCYQWVGAAPGYYFVAVFYYYHALALLACDYPDIGAQRTALEQVESHQNNLKFWASHVPENFLHKFHLVEAERQRFLDNKAEAIDLYDKAIAGAKENEFIQEEALANELAAKFYLTWGKEKIAADYMQAAYYCYARWGAKAKVIDLEKCYPQLLSPILQQSRTTDSLKETIARGTLTSTHTTTSISEAL